MRVGRRRACDERREGSRKIDELERKKIEKKRFKGGRVCGEEGQSLATRREQRKEKKKKTVWVCLEVGYVFKSGRPRQTARCTATQRLPFHSFVLSIQQEVLIRPADQTHIPHTRKRRQGQRPCCDILPAAPPLQAQTRHLL